MQQGTWSTSYATGFTRDPYLGMYGAIVYLGDAGFQMSTVCKRFQFGRLGLPTFT